MTTTTALSETALFQINFALHLAVGLLGPTKLIKHLQNESMDNPQQQQQQQRVPLYWRSELILPDALILLQNNCEEGEKKSPSTTITVSSNKLLFFDVTFDFVKKKQQEGENNKKYDDDSGCQVFVSLGFFLLLPNGTADDDKIVGHYISTKALDSQQLVSHSKSLQLDLQQVSAQGLATFMFESFLSQGGVSSESVNAKYLPIDSVSSIEENEDDLLVNIPYKDIGNAKGTFLLKISTVSKFDKSALRFLYWDFIKNANHYRHQQNQGDNESVRTESEKQVEEAFDAWKKRRLKEIGLESTNTISDSKNGESIATTTSKSKKRSRPIVKRRRKKGGNDFQYDGE